MNALHGTLEQAAAPQGPLIAILKETGEVLLSDEERFWLPIVSTEEAWKEGPVKSAPQEGTDSGADVLRGALQRFLMEDIVGQ